MNHSLLLFSFSADIKTIAIIVLLSILFGVFLTMRNHRGGGAYVEDKSSGSIFMLLLLALIAGIILYSFFSSSVGNTAEKKRVKPPTEQLFKGKPFEKPQMEKERFSPPVNPSRPAKKEVYLTSARMYPFTSHVNQSPSLGVAYTIQVAACSLLTSTDKVTKEFYQHKFEIIWEDGLHKVLISRFPSRTAAKQYQRKHGVEGFIRLLEDSEWLVARDTY